MRLSCVRSSTMKTLLYSSWIGGLVLVLVVVGPGTAAPAEASATDEGFELQSKGPVDEAYARPFQKNPQPSPVGGKQPPKPLKECPPAQKPDGEVEQMIPG